MISRKIRLCYIAFALFAISSVLPAGSFYSVPVKIITFVILIFSFVFSKRRSVDLFITLWGGVVFFLICWSMIGVVNGFSVSVQRELYAFASLLAVIIAIYYMQLNKIVDIEFCFKCFVLVMYLFVGWKIALEVFYMTGVMSREQIVSLLKIFFDAQVMSWEVSAGGIRFCRIGVPNDQLPILVGSFLCILERKNYHKLFLIVGLLFLHSLISFSRIFIVQVVLFVVFLTFFDPAHRDSKHKKTVVAFCALAFVLVGVISFGGADLFDLLSTRFNSSSTEYSDAIRVEQFSVLWAGFCEDFVMGKGMGAYVLSFIRDSKNLFSYEIEYLSFLFQFGALGFSLIIGGIVILVVYMVLHGIKQRSVRWIAILDLMFLFVKPLFNPYFLSSSAGCAICAIYLCSRYISDREVLL